MKDIMVFVFLGNPGREYSTTRHNIGWMIAESLVNAFGRTNSLHGINSVSIPSWYSKFDGYLTMFTLKGRKIYFFKPTNFMNLSGQAVRKLLDFYKLGKIGRAHV